jgi:hypothetical protein
MNMIDFVLFSTMDSHRDRIIKKMLQHSEYGSQSAKQLRQLYYTIKVNATSSFKTVLFPSVNKNIFAIHIYCSINKEKCSLHRIKFRIN